MFDKICKFGFICGSRSFARLTKHVTIHGSRSIYYGHENGLGIAEVQQFKNISRCEDHDYLSNFKLVHGIVKRILTDEDNCLNSPIISKRNEEVIDYNVIGGRCNRLRLFLNTYSNLSPISKLSDQHVILLLSVMGYINEMLLSAYLIVDDFVDDSEKRRNKPTWFKKVGRIAISDILLIESGIYLVMRKFFENEPYFEACLKVLHDVKWIVSCSLSLDYLTFDVLGTNKKNCNWEIYNQICFGIMGISGFYMPIAMAMHMADYKFDLNLLLKMAATFGHYATVENDFADRYADTTGKIPDEDIKLGKLTWLLLTALQHADSRQKTIIENCYGKDDPECIKAIVDVYEQLQMKDKCISHKKNILNSASKEISLISATETRKCFTDAFNMIDNWYKDLCFNHK